MRRRPRRRRKFTEAEVEVYVQSVLPRVIEEAVGAPNEKLDDGKRMHEELKSRRQQLVDERVKAEPSEEDGSETSKDEICGICGLCFEQEHSDDDEAGSEAGTDEPTTCFTTMLGSACECYSACGARARESCITARPQVHEL
mmetsp:Transcript_1825/g.5594  ORF Transcript_1825/g.5594 Transcript_1825/m.5594 type:complete len:142 (-) Transcript_1825:142-567(-)